MLQNFLQLARRLSLPCIHRTNVQIFWYTLKAEQSLALKAPPAALTCVTSSAASLYVPDFNSPRTALTTSAIMCAIQHIRLLQL
jgi:hypothetical protein